MSRIKLLLDIIEDVRAAADNLQTIADAAASCESAANPRKRPYRKSMPKETIRPEEVRVILAAKSCDGYGAQVRKLIARHGGRKLSDIDPSEYGAVLKEAEMFGHAT